MKLMITKQEYMAQLSQIGRRFEKPEVVDQCSSDWDRLTACAGDAQLYIRGYNKYFGCHMASPKASGFFNIYLPISPATIQ